MAERSPLPRMPEHPKLRQLAEVLEESQISGELTDERWRIVFMSSEELVTLGIDPDERERYYGISPIVRFERFPEWRNNEGIAGWWEVVAPLARHDVRPEDPDFEEIFSSASERARALEPPDDPPIAVPMALTFTELEGHRGTWLGDSRFIYQRIYDDRGDFLGMLLTANPEMSQSLALRLARGDAAMHARMDRLREPERRAAAILFADLEASGALSRRLSSRAYFELIRSLTDLIDSAVAKHGGIIGKHAGDGASALFLASDAEEGEAGAAAAAISAARAIREGAGSLGAESAEVGVRVGVHWGATLTVGQVSTRGRLEVTALGDEMNEAARIESAAPGGAVLASKELIERLSAESAAGLGIEPDELTYRALAELVDSEKARRDAGQVAVAEV